ncbi:MAG: dolichyl-phosphate-mannose--protein mannosyltransferase [Candidatus Dormibacteria bacterium]
MTLALEAAPPPARLRPRDVKVILAITVFAFFLRLLSPIIPDFATRPLTWPPVRVLGLGHPFQAPNGYIFDEVYFAQDACKDLVGMDYLDPEPPLAKLVIATGIVVGGAWMHYDRGHVVPAGKTCEAQGTLPGFGTWGWRLASLVFGTALVPLIYLLALRMWPDRFFATTAALLMTFDGMAFVQSRIAMIDAVALALLLLAYWVFHLHRDARSTRRWWLTLAAMGLTLGMSVAAKWTTLAALGTMVVVLVGGWLLTRVRLDTANAAWSLGSEPWRRVSAVGPRDRFVRAYVYLLFLVVIPGMVYTLSYFRYNSIPHCSTTASGGLEVPSTCPADHLPPPMLRLTKAGPIWIPTGLDPVGYIHQMVVHDQWSFDYHAHLTATHTYGSAWYSWPFLLRPVAYYYQDNLAYADGSRQPLRAEVFNLGNPAIWWASIPALVYCGISAVRRRRYAPAVILLAFLAAWLPFSRVTRVMFLYHMFGGLPFMILAVSYAVAQLRHARLRLSLGGATLPTLEGRHLAGAYLLLVLVVFMFFYPLWSALPITGDQWNQRIWFNLGTDTKISWI